MGRILDEKKGMLRGRDRKGHSSWKWVHGMDKGKKGVDEGYVLGVLMNVNLTRRGKEALFLHKMISQKGVWHIGSQQDKKKRR